MDLVISFHPCIQADINIICAGRPLTPDEENLVKNARAIILPQGCRPGLYWLCRKSCPCVFPNFDCRFSWQGKIGDALLFQRLGLPHPQTKVYNCFEEFLSFHTRSCLNLPFPYPFVLKGNHGGEGSMVYLIRAKEELLRNLLMLQGMEQRGACKGFVLQQYVKKGNRDMRSVVIGEKLILYWRYQRDPDNFLTNVGAGAVISHDVSHYYKEKAESCIRRLCSATAINLAAIDLLFTEASPDSDPLLLEINYYFGPKGLGGSERFYELLSEAVSDWLERI
jgi:ribosomal protein S6--L-glutamate ligase